MDPKFYPGGESPGASGAHDAAVFLQNVSVHVGDISEGLVAVGASMDAGDV